jgi:hypothetical protein
MAAHPRPDYAIPPSFSFCERYLRPRHEIRSQNEWILPWLDPGRGKQDNAAT